MTKVQIIKYANDITSLGDHFLIYANRGKIKQFEKKYGALAGIFMRKQNQLQDEYFVIENGQIKTEKKDGKKEFIMKEGKLLSNTTKRIMIISLRKFKPLLFPYS